MLGRRSSTKNDAAQQQKQQAFITQICAQYSIPRFGRMSAGPVLAASPSSLDAVVEICPPLGPVYLDRLSQLVCAPRRTPVARPTKPVTEVERWRSYARQCFGNSFKVSTSSLVGKTGDSSTSHNMVTAALREVLRSCVLHLDGIVVECDRDSRPGSVVPALALFTSSSSDEEKKEEEENGEQGLPFLRVFSLVNLSEKHCKDLVEALVGLKCQLKLPYLSLTFDAQDPLSSASLLSLLSATNAQTGNKVLQDTVVSIFTNPDGAYREQQQHQAHCCEALINGWVKDVQWPSMKAVLDVVRKGLDGRAARNTAQRTNVGKKRPRSEEEGNGEDDYEVGFKFAEGSVVSCPVKVLKRFSKLPLFHDQDHGVASARGDNADDPGTEKKDNTVELPIDTEAVSPHALRFVISSLDLERFLEEEIELGSDWANVLDIAAKAPGGEEDLRCIMCARHYALLRPLGFPWNEKKMVDDSPQKMHTILAVLRVCEFLDIPFIGNLVLLALAMYLRSRSDTLQQQQQQQQEGVAAPQPGSPRTTSDEALGRAAWTP